MKTKTPPTSDQALLKAQKYCAYQERSQQEVRDRLYSWGLHKGQVEPLISQLISDGFLKEERFAIAFAGGKFRVRKWGRNKIRQALKLKQVPEGLIRRALSEIPETDYRKTLQKILNAREKLTTEKNPYKKKYKLATYAIQRGYEPELVWELLGSDE